MTATFTRNSTAYLQDGTLVNTNLPRYETGKFAQAVTVEGGTANAHSNPRLETSVTGWDGSYRCSLTRTNERAIFGEWSARIVADDPAANWFASTQPTLAFVCAPSTVYAFSIPVFSATSNVGRTRIEVNQFRADSSHVADLWSAFSARRGEWERLTVVFTSHAEAARLSFRLRGDVASVPGDTYWATAAQIEPRGYVTSFHQATRAPETLTIPSTGVLSPTAGTIEQYASLFRAPGTNEQFIFDGAGAANRNLQVLIATNGLPTLRYGTGAATVEIQGTTAWVRNTQYAIAWKWETAGVKLLVNGAVVASSGTAPSIEFGANAYLGSRADGTLQLDGLIDDLRISSRARTDAEILTGFNSNAPLPLDADTTAKFTFDGVLTNLFTNYTGLTAATIVPSSEQVYSYGHTGLTVAEALPSAEIAPSYAHAGIVAVNVIPVAKWFFAPPPGVPQYMFSVPREEYMFSVPREADFYVR